jgi:hypothetical protein
MSSLAKFERQAESAFFIATIICFLKSDMFILLPLLLAICLKKLTITKASLFIVPHDVMTKLRL